MKKLEKMRLFVLIVEAASKTQHMTLRIIWIDSKGAVEHVL